MVAVAPGAAASSDSPSSDGSLDSLFDGGGKAGERAGSAGRARLGTPEALSTTIDLSAAADPAPGRRGAVSLRHIVGARPPSGRWVAGARRSARIGGWLAGAITVSAGLVALWVLLFTTVSGGDVWLGRPLAPTKHDQNATQRNAVPGAPGAGSLRPSSSASPQPSASAASKAAASKAAAPSSTSGRSGGGSGTTGSGSGVSGRNGADDPPADDAGGSRTTATTTTTTSGSGSGTSGGSGGTSGGSGGTSGGSGGSGKGSNSVSGSVSGGGSGGHGADG